MEVTFRRDILRRLASEQSVHDTSVGLETE